MRGSGAGVSAVPRRKALDVRAIVATAASAGRRNVWRVLAVVESTLPDPHSTAAILELLTVRAVAVAVLESAIGLVQVALCYRLIALHGSALDAPALGAGS